MCLQKHYHPVVRRLAVHVCQGAPSEGSAALGVELSRRYEHFEGESAVYKYCESTSTAGCHRNSCRVRKHLFVLLQRTSLLSLSVL